MPVTPEQPAPYAPPTAIIELIKRHRSKGLPSPVNSDVLERAGIAESLIPRTLQSLAALGLIDQEGKPTAALEGLRLAREGEFQERVGEWLNNVYADALQFVNPATDDEEKVRDAFRKYNPIGQQPRMVSLFMGLYRFAGIAPDKAATANSGFVLKKRVPLTLKPRPAKQAAPAAAVEKAAPGNNGTGAAHPSEQPRSGTQADFMAALLAKFPEFDPAWPDDIKAKWFAGFERFMGAVPK